MLLVEISMKESSYLPEYSDDDVLSFKSTLFKIARFREGVKYAIGSQVQSVFISSLQNSGINIPNTTTWFGKGVDCEILKIGAQRWQKGKVRIRVSLEFIPDEAEIDNALTNNQSGSNQIESSLDDIRQIINKSN